jgi:hypothetical protein
LLEILFTNTIRAIMVTLRRITSIVFLMCMCAGYVGSLSYWDVQPQDVREYIETEEPAVCPTILLHYGTGHNLSPLECELHSYKTAFDTNVHVAASVSYPHLIETSPLARYVNEAVQKEAYGLYDSFVQEMSVPQKDLWDEDADERVFHYDLNLVYSAPVLIGFYGSRFQYTGGAHGSVQYITKTFWQHDDTIRELSLDDLFLPGYREPLFRYCEEYFKSNRCGYYGDDELSWVPFNPEHLDAFLLTENGILLMFQNYVVSGYEDCPVTLLISYPELFSIVKPNHPSPLDHFWPTGS